MRALAPSYEEEQREDVGALRGCVLDPTDARDFVDHAGTFVHT